MKKVVILFVALFFFQLSNASELSIAKDDNSEVNIEIIDTTINEFSCTIGFKVYIPTQSGIVGFGMRITADTCEEASEGMNDAIAGFISGMFQ